MKKTLKFIKENSFCSSEDTPNPKIIEDLINEKYIKGIDVTTLNDNYRKYINLELSLKGLEYIKSNNIFYKIFNMILIKLGLK